MVNAPSFGPYVKTFTLVGLLISIAFYSLLLLVILLLCVFTIIVDMPLICHKDLIMLVPLLAVGIFVSFVFLATSSTHLLSEFLVISYPSGSLVLCPP